MMINIPGYQLSSRIYESDKSVIYRVWNQDAGCPELLKLLKTGTLTAAEAAVYHREFEMTHGLNLDCVVSAKRLENVDGTLALLFDYVEATPLDDLISGASLSLGDRLKIASLITDAVGKIHAARIIHKNLCPANILIEPASLRPRLIDFGIATRLDHPFHTLQHPVFPEGNLACISPEQTGRLNRSVDYRSDYYSLGACLYVLFTGTPPFQTGNTLEMLHAHIARNPEPPHHRDPAIPEVVSALIMKLLEKPADQRYQSTQGILADLDRCRATLRRDKGIAPFPIAENDRSAHLRTHQRLYGRELDIALLSDTYQRVTRGSSELVWVTGPSGIGKSALIKEVFTPLSATEIYFACGKFDRYQRGLPFSALIEAISGLVRQLLTESEDRLERWRSVLTTALGANAQIIIDIIPRLELIIGRQPKLCTLSRAETEQRFNYVFQNFIRAIQDRKRPLVVFLDDLQWADPASLKLIERILTDSGNCALLFIGAYRDYDVHGVHPLAGSRDRFCDGPVCGRDIELHPLSRLEVRQLVADMLQAAPDSVSTLAMLVSEKTQGNPYFIHAFMDSLREKGLLRQTGQSADAGAGGWHWNLDRIKALNITDNVADLMVDRINRLSESTRQLLCLAACIGNRFDIHTLAQIQGISLKSAYEALSPALQEGLIIALSEVDIPESGANSGTPVIGRYRFAHDRVHQTVHESQSNGQRQNRHLKIGRLLVAGLSGQQRMNRLFELVDHLNAALALIKTPSERIRLAELNLAAGKKANLTNAHSAALHYFLSGCQCLAEITKEPEEAPDTLAFDLQRELAEAEFANGRTGQSLRRIGALIENSRSLLDKATLYGMLIWWHTLQSDHRAAIEAGITALSLLGIDVPGRGVIPEVLTLQQEQASAIFNDSGDQIIDDPRVMSDSTALSAMLVLSNLSAAAFRSDKPLFAFIATKMVNLTQEYGIAPESSFGLAIYGTTLVTQWEQYDLAHAACRFALQLAKRLNDPARHCQAAFVAANFVLPWVRPLSFSDTLNQQGCNAGMESATLQFVGNMRAKLLFNAFYQGKHLSEILSAAPEVLAFGRRTDNRWAIGAATGLQIIVRELSAKRGTNAELASDRSAESEFLETSRTYNGFIAICLYQILKTQALYLSDRFQEALESAASADALLPYVGGMFATAAHLFYHSLSLAAVYPELTGPDRDAARGQLDSQRETLRTWARQCPENFLQMHWILEAEHARLGGQEYKAADFYDNAVNVPATHSVLQTRALALELAGRFWLTKQKDNIAGFYLRDAFNVYKLWGAESKAESLKTRYAPLLTAEPGRSGSLENTFAAQDLAAVMKAAQALSGHIVLDELLSDLMAILIEIGGARKAFLILDQNGQLQIEAERDIESGHTTLLQSVPLASIADSATPRLPLALINYVARTRESVLMNDGLQGFAADPYVMHMQPKSLLCLPILYQGKLSGVLYLENNLTRGAFTEERLQILQLLSGQAAISIENARHYQNLEKQVEKRTLELQAATASAEQARREAELASQAKSAFLARMSHELRTPLNGILGFAQILNRTEELSDKSRNAAQTIEQCGNHLLNLINDILDLSRIEAGKLALHTETFSFQHCLESILDMVRIRAETKRLGFSYEPQTPLPESVVGDKGRICQILLNLLGNAIKFTPAGQVCFRVFYENGTACFEVEDTGIGIPEETFPRIFEPFYNLNPDSSDGTGLGLAITRELVDSMGGRIELKSGPDKGSLFRVSLQLPEAEPAESEPPVSPQRVTGYAGQRRHILVADDHSVNRRMLADMLIPLGFRISEAENGFDTLDKVRTDPPDMILMDLVMPAMNGLDAAGRIKSDAGTRNIKILAISASSYEYNAQQALSAGCDGFLAKPVSMDRLVEKIGALLGLEWHFADSLQTASCATSQTLIMPGPADLRTLHDLLKSGDVQGLMDKAESLNRTDPSLEPFATRLKTLAENFEMRQIRRFLADAFHDPKNIS